MVNVDGGVICFGYDNKIDLFENLVYVCMVVFDNFVIFGINGSVLVEVFGFNQLGLVVEYVQQVCDGLLQVMLMLIGVFVSYYLCVDVLNLLFVFNGNVVIYEVFDGDFGKVLVVDIEVEFGDVVVLGFLDMGGFFVVMNLQCEIVNFVDFDGIWICIMMLLFYQMIVKVLGVEVYLLFWGEVYFGLQIGVIDGQMNLVLIIFFVNFVEVQEYLMFINYLFLFYIFLMNWVFYESLFDSEKVIVYMVVENCVVVSCGLLCIIEVFDCGFVGFVDIIKVIVLSDEQCVEMVVVIQLVFEMYVVENFDLKVNEFLVKFCEVVSKVNVVFYLN